MESIDYRLDNTEMHFCLACAEGRNLARIVAQSRMKNNWRPEDIERSFADLNGAISEYAGSLATGYPMDTRIYLTNDGPDGLRPDGKKRPDLGKDLEVRSTDHVGGHLLLYPRIPNKEEGDDPRWRYMLAIVRENHVSLRGWVYGLEAMLDKYLEERKPGRLTYWVPQRVLRPMATLLEVRQQLAQTHAAELSPALEAQLSGSVSRP